MTTFRDMTIAGKLMLLVVIFLLGFALFAWFAFTSLDRVKVNGPIYRHIVQNQVVIQEILPPPLNIIESQNNVLEMIRALSRGASAEELDALVAKAAELRREYEEHYALWVKTLPEGALRKMLAESHGPAMEFYQERDQKLIPAVRARALASADSVVESLQRKYLAHRAAVEKAVSVAVRHAREDEMTAAETVARAGISLLIIGVGTASLTLLLSLLISRSISLPLSRIAAAAHRVAEGKFDPAPLPAYFSRDEVGALVQAFNSMTTRLSETISELRGSETKYRIVADETYDWEFWRDPAGKYIYSSPSCERITGRKPADFAADQDLMLRIIHPEDRAFFQEHQLASVRGEETEICERDFRIITAAGGTHWVSHVCRPVYDEEGRYLGRRGTNRDITEKKKAEAELVEAKEQAEAANRAKSAFISSMSHELRTPLNAIMGYTQILLRDQNLNDTQRAHLEVLRRSGEHLLILINDILDMVKIEGEKMALEEVSFDPSLLLNQVLEIARANAGKKGLRADYRQSGTLPPRVRGDQRKVQQVLINLLDNAVKYTRHGEVALRAEYHQGLLRCEVSDTGIGIAPDSRDAIFEPFTQLVREGQVTEGTGLGLTIARHLVILMRGKISVESEVGKGSTFAVEIPLPAVSAGEIATPAALPVMPAAETRTGEAEEEFQVPPPEKLRELSELAMLGDMRRIRNWAEELRKSDSRYCGFAAEVHRLAEGFRAKAITALAEKYLQWKDDSRHPR